MSKTQGYLCDPTTRSLAEGDTASPAKGGLAGAPAWLKRASLYGNQAVNAALPCVDGLPEEGSLEQGETYAEAPAEECAPPGLEPLEEEKKAADEEVLKLQKELQGIAAALEGAPPTIIPREQWGAARPLKDRGWDEYPKDEPLPLHRIVVHHTADPQGQTARELQEKEMGEKQGFADLPYHFVITADGSIHEGRSIGAVGAHAGSFDGNEDIRKDPDWGSVGIALTGDFESRLENGWNPNKPTPRQESSLKQLLAHLTSKYAIPPGQILKHSEVKRDGPAKDCPGDHLDPVVEKQREELERLRARKPRAEAELKSALERQAKAKKALEDAGGTKSGCVQVA